ncbi:MAG: TetR/AcrR family transcriptional regulator C-terminal ligand-binding domain-containing protein [Bacilli bacterium]|jgi:AcrR family transcriptional regulator|nr:TetR/AcrR family transcriptional regulator C-terminal ligand-binding domain-containing protein [Bacilli bacterium]
MPSVRRRGQVLKEAIYEATLKLLDEGTYKDVTFNNVARLAKTSRSVLYNNWATPFDLLIDASRWQVLKNRKSIMEQEFDNGNLRSDLIELGRHFLANSLAYPKKFLGAFLYELSQNNGTQKMLDEELKTNNLAIMSQIIEKAMLRKEITKPINDLTKLLLFEVLRYHAIILQDNVDENFIIEFIDSILLPALTNDK